MSAVRLYPAIGIIPDIVEIAAIFQTRSRSISRFREIKSKLNAGRDIVIAKTCVINKNFESFLCDKIINSN